MKRKVIISENDVTLSIELDVEYSPSIDDLMDLIEDLLRSCGYVLNKDLKFCCPNNCKNRTMKDENDCEHKELWARNEGDY